MAKKLDFDAEAQSQQADVPEPNTPEQLLNQPAQLDEGYDPGPPPKEVDAPERVEEQQCREDSGQAEGESDKPPKQPPDPPDPPEPPDPDAPDPNPDEEEEEDEEDEEGQEEGEEHGDCEEEEEKVVDEAVEVVESESTKKRRKITEHQQKVHDAAMARLPFPLAEKGPLYKGVEVTPNERPRPSIQWRAKKGAISKPKDKSTIDHRGNRTFENIRDHQISSLFTLQKHIADCEKGAVERISSLKPLRTNTGEFSPCKRELTTAQNDDAVWCYQYSELPGIFPMRYGMKTFDIIEQVPFNLSPQGPHKNLVRQITDELGIEVKRKKVNNKDVHYIDDLPTAMNPEAIRAARVLIHDVSNHQYDGSINRGLEYHPSVLNRPGAVPVSEVDAAGDWIHLASLVEMIKGVRQFAINDMPFYLRGLVHMVTLDHLHHILLYAALTDLKTNI